MVANAANADAKEKNLANVSKKKQLPQWNQLWIEHKKFVRENHYTWILKTWAGRTGLFPLKALILTIVLDSANLTQWRYVCCLLVSYIFAVKVAKWWQFFQIIHFCISESLAYFQINFFHFYMMIVEAWSFEHKKPTDREPNDAD